MENQSSYVVWGNWPRWWWYHLWVNVSTENIAQRVSFQGLPRLCVYNIFSQKTGTDSQSDL